MFLLPQISLSLNVTRTYRFYIYHEKKRMVLSVQDKSNTVERLKKDESACNLIAEHDARKSVISDIKDSESKLFQLRKNLYESNLVSVEV